MIFSNLNSHFSRLLEELSDFDLQFRLFYMKIDFSLDERAICAKYDYSLYSAHSKKPSKECYTNVPDVDVEMWRDLIDAASTTKTISDSDPDLDLMTMDKDGTIHVHCGPKYSKVTSTIKKTDKWHKRTHDPEGELPSTIREWCTFLA